MNKIIITTEKMEWWINHCEEYKIDKLAGSIPKDDPLKYYQLLLIEKRNRNVKDKLKEIEFYVKAYSYLYNIEEDKVKVMDFGEVKEKITTFRKEYE